MIFQRLIYQSILWRGIYFVSVLGLNIMIARYYEAADSGLIYFITNSLALVVTISSLSLESGIAYYIASGKMESSVLSNFAIAWSVISAVLIYLLLKILIFSEAIPPFYSSYYFETICYIGGCVLINFFTAIFYAERDFFTPNIIMTLVNFLLILLMPFSEGYWIDQNQYTTIYFWGFLMQGILVGSCFVLRNRKRWKIVFPSKKTLLPVFRYAFKAFGANLLFFLLYRIDYWFVERYCSADDLGNYIQVSKLVHVFLVIPAIMASAIFPIAAGNNKESARKSVLFLSRVITCCYIFISLILIVIGYWFFPFLYGNTFDNMYIPYLLLLPGIFFLSILNLLGAYFAGRNSVVLNIICSALGLAVIVAGDIIFIPANRIKAAALVSSMGYFVSLVFLIRMFALQYTLSLKELLVLQKRDIQTIKTWLIHKFH